MANSDKNILITPNIGSASADPKIVFSGASASVGPQNITLQVYPTNSGTISFEGSAGQLFSISNTLTGTIYSGNDVSGIPSIEVLDTGLVKLAQYSGNVLLGSGTDDGAKLHVVGGAAMTSGWNRTLTLAATSPGIVFNSNSSKWASINYDYSTDLTIRVGATSNNTFGTGVTALNINATTGVVNMPVTGAAVTGNTILHAGNYNSYSPTLTGTNASGTWSISISGNAATITSQANSATINASTGVNGNDIVRRDGNGYIYANHVNFNTTETENPTINSFITGNGDGWSRKSSPAHVISQLGLLTTGNYTSYSPSLSGSGASGTWGINISGNAATASNGGVTSVNGQTGAVTVSGGSGGVTFGKALVFAR